MKQRLIVLMTFSLLAGGLFAQSGYESFRDNKGVKILKGIISRDILAADTAFAWLQNNTKYYTPNAGAVEALKKNGAKVRIIVFGGTWCEDTQNILPKFFMLLDAAGFSYERLTLIGTDREKKTLGYLSEALNVTHVPTFIVMRDGKEVGRVVEYGKKGAWDMEIGELIVE